jgi:nicotinamidase-related amidase
MAGITTDVCIVYSAITAVEEGYQAQVVVDACDPTTALSDHTY